ncbi:MAG TPA: hypothetical protein VHF22_10755, partial [Planctomycetota bacterium]|nr:hypothetical protein [Planctomycetota bacterium]
MVNALLALLVLLSGALAGEWRGEGEDADEKLVLGADGRGELGGMRLAWRDEDGKTLVLRFDGIPQDVRFAYRVDVDGGVLTLQDAEGEAATYRRVGGKPAPGKPATPERPAAGAGTGTGAETVTGTAYEASGWGIDLEPGWKAQAQGETTLLVPPEVVVGCEVYGVTCKPVEPTPDYFDAQVATVAPFLQR